MCGLLKILSKFVLAVCLAAVLPFDSPARADSTYSPPRTVAGEDGWDEYVDPIMFDRAGASGVEPSLETAEGAVVLFLASRIRGDGKWKKAMTDKPGRRAKKALKSWRKWNVPRAGIRFIRFHRSILAQSTKR